MTTTPQNWYSSWFNTPYYHILYRDRGYEEAQTFMQNLTGFLNLKKGASILDLACGKGRHSIFLHELGYDVTGVDLSKNSIAYAKNFEEKHLKFKVHDMCLPMDREFDAVFNLFTSFGYFENEKDNLRTIKAIKANLNKNGCGVIDFMNVQKVIKNLVSAEVKVIKGIKFNLKRYVKDGFIIKEITFKDQGENFHFSEKVKVLTLEDFHNYFKEAEINLQHCFGDYQLQKFNPTNSDRLILVFQ